MNMDKVKLSAETKRAVYRLLCDASLARHLARNAADHVLAERESFYRSENSRFLFRARLLVDRDMRAQLGVRTAETLDLLRRTFPQHSQSVKEARNAPTQVSATAAFQRLRVLCVLGQNGLRNVAQGRTLSRLQAPWAAPECGRSMALRTPNAMRQALTVPPS